MTEEQKKNKEKFIKLLRENVGREGVEKVIEWLEWTDFFLAPASSKFHSNFEGGLCLHSLLVYARMKELNDLYKLEIPNDALTICGLLHDVCKANMYVRGSRNVKDEKGKWYAKPTWEIDEKIPLGHGEKSCILIGRFIMLATDELLAIRWHMAGYDSAVKGGDWSASRPSEKCNLVTLLQVADMVSSSFFESKID